MSDQPTPENKNQTQPEKTGEIKPQPQPAEKIEQAKQIKTKKENRKMMAGCFGAGCGALALVFFGFLIFLSQAGEGINPILKMLNIEAANLINILIDLANIGFGLFTFVAFIFAVIGLFKLGTVKKEDKEGKKKGMVYTLFGVMGFLVFVFLWISAYFYLDSRRINEPEPTQLIVTDPADLTDLTAPETVSFDASKIPYNPTQLQPLSYRWEFGDGETGTGETVSHSYKNKGPVDGRYKVVLTVTYKDLKTEKEVQSTYTLDVVFVNEKVKAVFEADPESGEAPLTVKFDASQSADPDGEIVSYEWEFNEDGRFDDAEGETAEYTFEKVGKYKVELRVTDNNDEFNLVEKIITVIEPNVPQAIISHDSETNTFLAGESYTFSGADSVSPNGNIQKYTWDFGDKSQKVETQTVAHIFKTAGTYTVTLTVTDEKSETAATTLEIKVKDADAGPKAVIATMPALTSGETVLKGAAPFKVEFDASKSDDKDNNIIDYQWDFDGNAKVDSRNIKAEYTYTEPGTYEAKLTVIDADDNQNAATLTVEVVEQGLKAELKADKVSGEVPLTVSFDAGTSSYPEGEIVSYEWDFGDGTSIRIADAKISHKYTSVGTFKAQVTVIASDGQKTEATLDINVRSVSLTACYEVNLKKGNAPLTVTFNPRCSKGTITDYKWDFGDGETSSERKPTHTFDVPGVYDVVLEVSDEDNIIDKFSDQIVVEGEVE